MIAKVIPFHAGHERGFGDFVDSDFDVICPVCYGHFFRYAFLPYLIFVISFVTIYFWHPLGLSNMLFIVLSLFMISYVSAVLRHRPHRLLLALLVLSSVTCLVLVRPTIGSITALPLDQLTLGPLALLAIAMVIGLGHGIVRIVSGGVHDASPLLSLVFLTSLVVTVADLAAKSAMALAPSLDRYPVYVSTSKAIDIIQRYKLAAILIAIAIAVVWAGGLSISTAQERVEENPLKRNLKHKWREEIVRLLLFFGLVLIKFSVGVWKLFRDTVTHLWYAASSCVRVFLLIVSAWALTTGIHELAGLASDLWEDGAFWLDSWRPLWAIPAYILLACLAIWAVIIIAFMGDKKNSTDDWGDDLFHALLVIRFNLMRSTPIYWFYLSLVLFISWFVISTLRLAKDPSAGFHVGVVFATYLGFLVILGAWNMIRRSFEARSTSDSEPSNSPPVS